MTDSGTGTWHYGLVARWWAEFNVAEPHELAFYRDAIQRFGQPVLDLGCGTGRFLVPLLEDGFDVDGSDVSADMIAQARALAARKGLEPTLTVEPMHQLESNRKYRTVYICGALGIGSRRDYDRETVRRVYNVLEPGGALLITDHEPFRPRPMVRAEWPATGERRTTSDGDEIELIGRLAEVDEGAETLTREIRARLWRDGKVVTEEWGRLTEIGYSADELERVLRDAGFGDVTVRGNYTDRPATSDDKMLTITATRLQR
jgi:SAM-dependent methyltransferase